MNISEKLTILREKMKELKIDLYLVPSADFHQSEYVGDYFKAREFISGFTGSAGTVLISQPEACLWTDGRYFIQAEKELAGTEFILHKSGQPEVPKLHEYIMSHLPQNGTLGFDGRVISMKEGLEFESDFEDNFHIKDDCDLIDTFWEDRPALPSAPAFLLSEKYVGESVSSKLKRLREKMQEEGATIHPLITLDDICWLLNIRGRDTAYSPVLLSYAVIDMEKVHLYADESKFDNDVRETLCREGVIFHPYNDPVDNIYNYIADLSSEETLLLDPKRMNYALYGRIPKDVQVIEAENPCVMMKAVKNPIEQENLRLAHLKDGVAHTKFMYWLKTTMGKETITEASASEKLEEFRRQQEHFLWPSFEPISAFGANAAMCHYSFSVEDHVELKEGTLFLTDTGGNYLEGSTDITRTVALGSISAEMKRDFTNVLKGNLALSRIHFPKGISGQHLDVLARQFLWQDKKDYNHGTGHGVGYLLSVHEDGVRISCRVNATEASLEEGMVVTDEPGLYVEGSHGIRLENELLVQSDVENEFGNFLRFEVLTFVPFDLDAVDCTLLTEQEKEQLNAYHKEVYEKVSPYLTKDEQEWLAWYTRTI